MTTNRHRVTEFGDERQCPRCDRIGYGEDSWHPTTTEFWPMSKGELSFARCKACVGEVMVKKIGMVQ